MQHGLDEHVLDDWDKAPVCNSGLYIRAVATAGLMHAGQHCIRMQRHKILSSWSGLQVVHWRGRASAKQGPVDIWTCSTALTEKSLLAWN